MDPQIEEAEGHFNRASNLLRVKTYVRLLKGEVMKPDVLKLLSKTHFAVQRVKVVNEGIGKLNDIVEGRLSKDLYQRCMFREIKIDLLKEIHDATELLLAETNLLTKGAEVRSVMDDLDKATDIFKRKVTTDRLNELRTVE